MKILLLLLLSFTGCREKVPLEQPPVNNNNNIGKTDVTLWLTSPSDNFLFQKQSFSLLFEEQGNSNPVIEVDSAVTFQEIDGFGNCLTGGSAIVINKMEQAAKTRLLKELFLPDSNYIGISYLRVSIGASDLSDHVFSYNDLPAGQTDPDLLNFSLEPDRADLIPLLKEILAINPAIKIMGSPWSAPVWMKTNGSSVGGSLKPEYFDAYASYFVKYINGMKDEGIVIDAITVQNEPLHDGNNPSMYMTAADQAAFIKNNLGPAFEAAGITTKIIVYDHNADRPDYPLAIYADANAAKYVDGAAFHLYGGSISALSNVHNAYPGKNLYFTEQWVGAPGNLAGDLAWHINNLVIGGTRNWCRVVLEWNMASDPAWDPHTSGGCDKCLGTVTIDGNTVKRNPAYYILAHCAKFVRPGSVRIESSLPAGLPNVAFLRPDGKKVLIVLNDSGSGKDFNLKFRGRFVRLALEKGAVGTYVW